MYRQGKRYIPLSCFSNIRSSVISQKDEFQNGYFKKTKHATFSQKKKHFLPRVSCTCAYQGVRNGRFRKIWRLALSSWNTWFEIRPFALLLTNFFSVSSITMTTLILCDYPLKPYCTHFGKIWWYLVRTQSYWPWLDTHIQEKCNLLSNPSKMEKIICNVLLCMI